MYIMIMTKDKGKDRGAGFSRYSCFESTNHDPNDSLENMNFNGENLYFLSFTLTHCGRVVPYCVIGIGGLDNDLLPHSIKPLPEIMLTNSQSHP